MKLSDLWAVCWHKTAKYTVLPLEQIMQLNRMLCPPDGYVLLELGRSLEDAQAKKLEMRKKKAEEAEKKGGWECRWPDCDCAKHFHPPHDHEFCKQKFRTANATTHGGDGRSLP